MNDTTSPATVRRPICFQCGKLSTHWFQPLMGIENFCSVSCVQTYVANHQSDGQSRTIHTDACNHFDPTGATADEIQEASMPEQTIVVRPQMSKRLQNLLADNTLIFNNLTVIADRHLHEARTHVGLERAKALMSAFEIFVQMRDVTLRSYMECKEGTEEFEDWRHEHRTCVSVCSTISATVCIALSASVTQEYVPTTTELFGR